MTFKPTNVAFIIAPEKAEDFLKSKDASAKKAMERFYAHQPKKGIKTPYKGSNE